MNLLFEILGLLGNLGRLPELRICGVIYDLPDYVWAGPSGSGRGVS